MGPRAAEIPRQLGGMGRGEGGVAGIASIEGLRRVRAVNAVENAVFVGLRRFGKETVKREWGWVGSLGR